jgi:hypothetical protein
VYYEKIDATTLAQLRQCFTAVWNSTNALCTTVPFQALMDRETSVHDPDLVSNFLSDFYLTTSYRPMHSARAICNNMTIFDG